LGVPLHGQQKHDHDNERMAGNETWEKSKHNLTKKEGGWGENYHQKTVQKKKNRKMALKHAGTMGDNTKKKKCSFTEGPREKYNNNSGVLLEKSEKLGKRATNFRLGKANQNNGQNANDEKGPKAKKRNGVRMLTNP